ncbi:UNVERIFIED_ORG: hypothetical protein GGR78_000570 [Xanthomonas campestris]
MATALAVDSLTAASQFLSNVPDVIWSGIVASGLTFMGVMLSNRSNTHRLLVQLSHDSEQKERDRVLTLRREVYLKVAEELARVSSHLSKIPHLDPVSQHLDNGLSEYFAASAKLQFVACRETAELSGELTMRYSEILMQLLTKAQPVHDLNVDVGLFSEAANKYQKDADRIVAAMREMNESGNPEPQRMKALHRSFEFSQEQASLHNSSRAEAQNKLPAALNDYTVALFSELRSVGALQMKFIASVRRELGLEADSSNAEAKLEAAHQRINRALDGLVESLERKSPP